MRTPGVRQFGEVHRHTWLLVLLVGAGAFFAVERALVGTENPHFVPTALLLGAGVFPVAFLAFVRGRRLPYDVSGSVVLAAGLLGGVIGTTVAGVLEYDVLRDFGALSMLGVALIEETTKLLVALALVVVVSRSRANGLLIGVACGAGFAAMETMGYAFVELVQSRGNITATTDLLLLRGFLSPAGHMAWTGIAAATLYAALATGWRRTETRRFLAAFAAAVALHAMWDGLGSLPAYFILAVLSLGLLTAVARAAGREGRAPGSAGPPQTARPRGAVRP